MNNGKICVSVCGESLDEMIARIKQAEEFADVIEVRFDCLEKNAYKSVFENLPETKKTYLFTFRPKNQGGKYELTIGERLKFWEHVFWVRKDKFTIDLEFDIPLMLTVDPSKIERIVSFHGLTATLDDTDHQWKTMSELADGTVKIAVQAAEITDGLAVWKLLERAKTEEKQVIPIAMGEAGKWTRILGLAHGSYMTYASLSEGQETANGQITAKDLIEIYRVKELDLDTKVYGVIGDPVSESLSSYIHNPAFVERGVNAVFIPLQVKNLDEFMRRMVKIGTREVELNFCGFSVTMPHKQAIIKHLDAMDPTAEKTGAVNTVKIEGGKLTGYNTDAHGFITPLKEKFPDLKNARVAILGSGGAARACVYALKQKNANVTVLARDKIKAKQIADEFEIQCEHLTTDHRPLTVDILVNATPLGMKGQLENESPFTAEQLKGVKFVYDLVTNPAGTPLIHEAKKANVPAINGLEMLLQQGAKQFEIWTGLQAPIIRMREVMYSRIDKTDR